jgi:hypothetical protein
VTGRSVTQAEAEAEAVKDLKSAAPELQPVDKSKATPVGAKLKKPRKQTREEWIASKAQALGLQAKPGEEWETFASRVSQA